MGSALFAFLNHWMTLGALKAAEGPEAPQAPVNLSDRDLVAFAALGSADRGQVEIDALAGNTIEAMQG